MSYTCRERLGKEQQPEPEIPNGIGKETRLLIAELRKLQDQLEALKECSCSLPDLIAQIQSRPAFYAEKLDFGGGQQFFETDQALGTTPTLYMDVFPPTAKKVRIDTIKYQLTPTNAVTYELYLLEDVNEDDQASESDIFFDSGAGQASGAVNIVVAGGSPSKLPITVRLAERFHPQSRMYYMVDWSGAAGTTTGYVKLYGEVLE